MPVINEVGNKYGLLTVIERGQNTKEGSAQWVCECECGNKTIVSGKNLRKGNTKSCGCLKLKKPPARKDLTGKRFGRLLVVGEPQNGSRGTIWKCLCDCGTVCYKVSADLVHGNTQSCGCYKKDLHSTMNDLTNQQFGELKALYTEEVSKDGQRLWVCQCSCGEKAIVRAGALRSGKTQSCGCKTSKGNLKIKKVLIEKGFEFKEEYSFLNLYRDSSQNPLRFDFALFKNEKLIALIEYNGRQHYEPIDFFGGVENFIDQQERDGMKLNFCKDKEIPLYIIKYNENIEEKMEEILSELYS